MIVDEYLDKGQLVAFAAAMNSLNSKDLSDLNTAISGLESDEFTLGVLSGYAGALNIIQTLGEEKSKEFYTKILIYLSDHMLKRESMSDED